MKKFNFKEFISKLEEESREFGMADTVSITYKGVFTPIKINGVVREELKTFSGSFCIYDVYDEEKTATDYNINVELLVLEEYADSPYSIYIDESGFVNADEYGEIRTIEVGESIVLKVKDGHVSHYLVKDL